MPAKVISFGISKGGCGKTTSAGITAHLLSQNHRVLAIDMDSQANLTQLLTGIDDVCTVFEEKTVLEAIKDGSVQDYIHIITENLHIVPSNDFLSILPRHLYSGNFSKNPALALKIALEPVINSYEYIILDLPPALGDQTICSIAASTHTIICTDGSKFAYLAIEKYIEICQALVDKGFNENLEIAGILMSVVDGRNKSLQGMLDDIDTNYPNARFETVIKRKAATQRIAEGGFNKNSELKAAIEHYHPVLTEILQRIGVESNEQQIIATKG